MQADRVGDSPGAGCSGQTLVVSWEGGEGAVREQSGPEQQSLLCLPFFYQLFIKPS